MDNLVKLPVAPEWVRAIDAKLLDWLVAKGYLQHLQRRDWRAVERVISGLDPPLSSFVLKYLELGHEIERIHRRIKRPIDGIISNGLFTTTMSTNAQS
jgi:hypothetical protein